MKEQLEAEAKRLKDLIEQYDNQRDAATRMANLHRQQLKAVERVMKGIPEQAPAEAISEISEGLQ